MRISIGNLSIVLKNIPKMIRLTRLSKVSKVTINIHKFRQISVVVNNSRDKNVALF